jgi:hypothetical protein
VSNLRAGAENLSPTKTSRYLALMRLHIVNEVTSRHMAYTVEGSFLAFYDAINLDGDHRETANARRDRTKELLAKNF